MDTPSKIFLLAIVGLIFSCSGAYLDKTSHTILKKYRKETSGALYVAQSKDKYKKYYFIGERNNHFLYFVSNDTGLPKKPSHYYAGQYIIQQDTMLLTYFENHYPLNLSNYMVKDPTGRFLYQKLNDTTQITLTIKYKGEK